MYSKLKILKIKITVRHKEKKICLKLKPISIPDKLHGSQGKNKKVSYVIFMSFICVIEGELLTHTVSFLSR